MSNLPEKIELYAYNVYFGDCFLMLFKYAGGTQKSVLIDFGSTGKGKHKVNPSEDEGVEIDESDERIKDSTGQRLLRVANHIKELCGEKLDVVVATHRHKDHIYGFGLKEAGRIIMDLKPSVVIQPWTENPDDNRDLTTKKSFMNQEDFKTGAARNFVSMLGDMHVVAESAEAEVRYLSDKGKFTKTIDAALRDQILFAADDNQIKNRAAVNNLRDMGENHYVNFGYDQVNWEDILPGVKVHILGPPSLDQSGEITSATKTSDEFWSLQAMSANFWGIQAATSKLIKSHIDGGSPLFGKDKVLDEDFLPPNMRWFVRQLRGLRANQLLEIVRFVDNALNNTSVIMLFEVGNQKMLFPGDAQIENWQYLLSQAKEDPVLSRLLKDTTVYKVGHHGSRNANPRSLWESFVNKNKKSDKSGKMKTVISTMKGKHGKSEDTEVPLPKMVREMKSQTDYYSTEEIKEGFYDLIEIEIEY